LTYISSHLILVSAHTGDEPPKDWSHCVFILFALGKVLVILTIVLRPDRHFKHCCILLLRSLNLCLKCTKAKYYSLLPGNIFPDFLSLGVSCVASVSEEFAASFFRFEMIVKLAHIFSCTLRCLIWRQQYPPKCGHIHLPNGKKSPTQDQH